MSDGASAHRRCACCRFLPPPAGAGGGFFLPPGDVSGSGGESGAPDAAAARSEAYRRLVTEASAASLMPPPLPSSNSPSLSLLLVDTHCHAHLRLRSKAPGTDTADEEPDEEAASVYHVVETQKEKREKEATSEKDLEGGRGGDYGDRRGDGGPRAPEEDNGAARASASSSAAVASLSCAVSPADWRACLEYAASAPTRVAALGVHPWYLDQILNEGDAAANEDDGDAGAHEDADAGYCRAGDGDTSSSTLASGSGQELATKWLRRLRCLLLQHPGCLVGEIGLCKQARFLRTYRGGKAEALRLQRLAFEAQLRVACELGRAASVHCVNQHGVLLQVLRSLADDLLRARARQERRHLQGPNAGPRGDGEKGWRDAEGNNDDGNRHGDGDNQDSWPSCASTLPPAIALHSFTGTAHHVQELLGWEAGLPPKLRYQVSGAYDISDDSGIAGRGDESNKNDAIDDPSPPLLYFGFSHAVNAAMCISEKSLRRGREAVRAVPKERLLVESDVSDPSDVLGGTTGAIAYLAWALGGDEDGGDAHGASVGGGKNQRHSQKAPIERTSETTSSKGPASEHSLDSSLPPLLRIAQLTAANGIRFLKQHRSE